MRWTNWSHRGASSCSTCKSPCFCSSIIFSLPYGFSIVLSLPCGVQQVRWSKETDCVGSGQGCVPSGPRPGFRSHEHITFVNIYVCLSIGVPYASFWIDAASHPSMHDWHLWFLSLNNHQSHTSRLVTLYGCAFQTVQDLRAKVYSRMRETNASVTRAFELSYGCVCWKMFCAAQVDQNDLRATFFVGPGGWCGMNCA